MVNKGTHLERNELAFNPPPPPPLPRLLLCLATIIVFFSICLADSYQLGGEKRQKFPWGGMGKSGGGGRRGGRGCQGFTKEKSVRDSRGIPRHPIYILQKTLLSCRCEILKVLYFLEFFRNSSRIFYLTHLRTSDIKNTLPFATFIGNKSIKVDCSICVVKRHLRTL